MSLSTVEAFKHISSSEGMVEVKGDTLKELQSTLLDMLKDFDRVCQKYDIPYTLSGGTMLGAVRHEGFIPWDDDIDLNITRDGYERFVSVFQDELADKYWLHRPEETENYGLGLARLRKKGTRYKDKESYFTEECGVFIDIFIYENVPNNPLLRKGHGVVSLALGFALSCRRFLVNSDEYLKLAEDDEQLTKVFRTKARFGKLFSFLSVDSWCRLWNKWNSLCGNSNSKYLSIPVGRKHYFGETFQRDMIFPVQKAKFEDALLPIPNTPDHYLTKLYGDYMRIPEPEEREAHVIYELDLGEEA